jgi:RNA polymerase sigma factor (sigma-70 family)
VQPVAARADLPNARRSPTRLHPAGFDALYRDEHPVMLRLAYLVTRSVAVAEELTQEAFLTVLERWHSLESPGGYLRTTLVRAAVRSRRRHERETQVAGVLAPTSLADDPAVDGMWDALGTLPPNQRAALALRFYEDYSHEQIAAALHCSVPTARSLTHRGLIALRKDMNRWTR